MNPGEDQYVFNILISFLSCVFMIPNRTFWLFMHGEMNAIARQVNNPSSHIPAFNHLILDGELLIYLFMYRITNQIFMQIFLNIY